MKNKLLRIFGKIRRPFAWIILATGFIGFLATLFKIIATGDVYFVTLTGFILMFLEGYDMVTDEEDNANSPASTEK